VPVLGALCIREIATPVVDRALSAIQKKSSSRARTAKIVISGVMRLAARHGAIGANPVREVGQIDSDPSRPPRALTADERKQWLDAVEANKKARRWDLPDLTRMMHATGCRIGKCLAIGWTEVDFDAEEVDIAWHLVRETGVGLTRKISTKSGKKGERLVPLPGWAVTMLKRRRAAIGAEVEPVFPDSLGGWRDPSNVRRVWREVRDKAEMDGLVSHALRKTVASFLDDANVSTRKISDQLGHAKVSMTQDRYLGRRLTDRQTAGTTCSKTRQRRSKRIRMTSRKAPTLVKRPNSVPGSRQALDPELDQGPDLHVCGPSGDRTPNPRTLGRTLWSVVDSAADLRLSGSGPAVDRRRSVSSSRVLCP
jgi:integrase